MSAFEPGEGWREVRTPPFEGEADYLTLTTADDTKDRHWVREEPVPPLPTEPYTVIGVTWKQDDTTNNLWPTEMMLDRHGEWAGENRKFSPNYTAEHITGFEVLAEPPLHIVFKQDEEHDAQVRRETAKAVLARVRDAVPHSGVEQMEAPLDDIAREFGVES